MLPCGTTKEENNSPPLEGCRGGLSPTGRTHPEGCAFYPSREGILRRGESKARGFTMIELMIVLTIISILVSIAIPIANSAILRAKEAVLQSDLHTLRTLIDQYTADKLKAPQSLDDLVTAGYLRSIPKDPITNATDWQVVMEETTLFPEQTEVGIADVHSNSNATTSNGQPYSGW